MKWMIAVLVVVGAVTSAQADGVPNENMGRTLLIQVMRHMFPKAPEMAVTSFHEINGEESEVNGVHIFRMSYDATVEFPRGLQAGNSNIWDQLGGSTPIMESLTRLRLKGFRAVRGGSFTEPQIFAAHSVMLFKKTDRGWALQW